MDANPEIQLLKAARWRAKRRGLPCRLTREDIVIPVVCPVLGLKLQRGAHSRSRPGSPSLDRIDHNRGYVPGNVVVVSHRANKLRNDASVIEVAKILKWMRKVGAP